MRRCSWLWVCAVAACVLIAPSQVRAQSFDMIPAGAQLRDMLIDADTRVAYAAAYDRGQVWKIDLATKERLSFGVVGSGPSSLAISADGATLACVNRLDHTLTLLGVADMQPRATVTCGEGASHVAALANGSFAVANSFADSVTIVDPASPDTPRTVEGVASVPSLIEGIENGAVVAVQTPPALVVLNDSAVLRTIPLPEVPVALAVMSGNRVAVATATEIALYDANSGSRIASRNGAYLDLAADGDAIVALASAAVEVLGADFDLLDSKALPQPARFVKASQGIVAALSPNQKSWQLATAAGTPRVMAAAPAPPAAPEPTPEVAPDPAVPTEHLPAVEEAEVVEPEPAEVAEPQPVEVVEPQPAPEQPKDIEVASASPVETPAPVTTESPVEEPAPATAAPEHIVVRQPSPIPSSAFEVRAPMTTRRPSPIPTFPDTDVTLSEGLQQPELGSGEGGFVPPDWTKPLENMQADRQVVPFGENQQIYEAYGNVRLKLEDTLFQSDTFKYDEATGEAFAEGKVRVTQGVSTLEADTLRYSVTPREQVAPLSPLAAAIEDEQTQERKRLTVGRISGDRLHVVEPTREITADHVDYDFATQSGEIVKAQGRAGIYYFGADRIRLLGPESFDAEDIWVTTCDLPTPHYRIRLSEASMREGEVMQGSNGRLQFGRADTPIYWPKWQFGVAGGAGIGFDFDSGRTAELGYYLNVAQWFPVTPDARIGLRLFPTEKEGTGFGIDAAYDYLRNPASPLFRAKGSLESLFSTEGREFIHWYNRYDLADNTIMLNQIEHWGDQEVFKDYYYDRFRDRSEPRTFTNVTYTRPTHIASGTIRVSPNNWVRETDRMPELTFHMLERPLLENVYVTYDGVLGYNERNPAGTHATRFVNVGRVSLDLDINEAFSITPFLEAEATWYSDDRDGEGSISRFSTVTGVTAQTRFFRNYPGFWGFSEFKHVVVPSITLSYRPEPTVDVDETPRFDAYDNVYGRSRLETKIDNIFLGRDAETEEVWQVARLSLYQGNDFWNEFRKSDDYEMELDIRPRPWWGFQGALERHNIEHDYDLDRPFFLERLGLELYDDLFDKPLNEALFQTNAQYSDYNRVLSFLYYDGTPLGHNYNGRIGFAYTATDDEVFNREILYGAGYKFNELWAVAFEHRYDLERDELTRQTYEIRRALHCWEMALKFRDRESGWDVGVEFNIRAFPGSKVRF